MTENMLIFIAGVVTGLAVSLIIEFVRHLLALRTERIKRGWEKQERLREDRLKQIARPESLDDVIRISQSAGDHATQIGQAFGSVHRHIWRRHKWRLLLAGMAFLILLAIILLIIFAPSLALAWTI